MKTELTALCAAVNTDKIATAFKVCLLTDSLTNENFRWQLSSSNCPCPRPWTLQLAWQWGGSSSKASVIVTVNRDHSPVHATGCTLLHDTDLCVRSTPPPRPACLWSRCWLRGGGGNRKSQICKSLYGYSLWVFFFLFYALSNLVHREGKHVMLVL